MDDKNNVRMYIVGALIIAAIVLVCAIFVSIKRNEKHADEHGTVYDLLNNEYEDKNGYSHNKRSFYLRFDGDRIRIFTEPDRKFYDYADLDISELPGDIKEQLKLGMFIDGEDVLYDFLQAYSS